MKKLIKMVTTAIVTVVFGILVKRFLVAHSVSEDMA